MPRGSQYIFGQMLLYFLEWKAVLSRMESHWNGKQITEDRKDYLGRKKVF